MKQGKRQRTRARHLEVLRERQELLQDLRGRGAALKRGRERGAEIRVRCGREALPETDEGRVEQLAHQRREVLRDKMKRDVMNLEERIMKGKDG